MDNIEVAPKEYWKDWASTEEVILYVQFLEIEGKQNWRIPSAVELGEIIGAANVRTSTHWIKYTHTFPTHNTIFAQGAKKLIPVRDISN